MTGMLNNIQKKQQTNNIKSMYYLLQLLEYKSFTYTYLLGDPDTKECILIDPVIETAERDAKIVKDMGLKLLYGGNVQIRVLPCRQGKVRTTILCWGHGGQVSGKEWDSKLTDPGFEPHLDITVRDAKLVKDMGHKLFYSCIVPSSVFLLNHGGWGL